MQHSLLGPRPGDKELLPEHKHPLSKGGSVVIRPTSLRFPLGQRGERPVRFVVPSARVKSIELLQIPGVITSGCYIDCTWDCVPIVAHYLGEQCPPLPDLNAVPLPGRDEFIRLGLHKKLRPYQLEATAFMAVRAYGMNCLPMRGGKTAVQLATAILTGSKRTLIMPPAFVRRVWAEQISTWTQEEAVMLFGRGGRELRVYCSACSGRGRSPEATKIVSEKKKLFSIKEGLSTEREVLRAKPYKDRSDEEQEEINSLTSQLKDLNASLVALESQIACSSCKKRNGAATGERLYLVEDLPCPKHETLLEPAGESCPKCQEELLAQIEQAKYVIINPDLLVAQKASTDTGVSYYREDLVGWGPTLAKFSFDFAVLDESHQIRGVKLGDKEDEAQRKRDRIVALCEHIDRVHLVTGTPIFGYTRDLWSQLDFASKSLWGSPWDPHLPFWFDAHYCEGYKAEFGWKATGRSPRAETELEPRLKMLKIQPARSTILPFMPKKNRQVIRLDLDAVGELASKTSRQAAKSTLTRAEKESIIMKQMRRASKQKRPVVIENVIAELAERNKVIVFAKHHESVEEFTAAIQKAIIAKTNKRRMEQVNAEVWAVHGAWSSGKSEDPERALKGGNEKIRHEAARKFREHNGAAVFVASIDAFQVGVSLRSKPGLPEVSSVHFTEFDYSPSAMLQAEDRPYEPGITRGLSIIYYIALGTIDERIERNVLPKIETIEKLTAEEGSSEMLRAFIRQEEETIDDIFDRLTGHIDG